MKKSIIFLLMLLMLAMAFWYGCSNEDKNMTKDVVVQKPVPDTYLSAIQNLTNMTGTLSGRLATLEEAKPLDVINTNSKQLADVNESKYDTSKLVYGAKKARGKYKKHFKTGLKHKKGIKPTLSSLLGQEEPPATGETSEKSEIDTPRAPVEFGDGGPDPYKPTYSSASPNPDVNKLGVTGTPYWDNYIGKDIEEASAHLKKPKSNITNAENRVKPEDIKVEYITPESEIVKKLQQDVADLQNIVHFHPSATNSEVYQKLNSITATLTDHSDSLNKIHTAVFPTKSEDVDKKDGDTDEEDDSENSEE